MEASVLTKEIVLIIGLGEIGHTLFALLNDAKKSFAVYGLDLDQTKMRELGQSRKNIPDQIGTIHICLSCSNQQNFVDITVGYIEEFKPKLVIIDSTVAPGTTMKAAERCKCLVAHSPSRG